MNGRDQAPQAHFVSQQHRLPFRPCWDLRTLESDHINVPEDKKTTEQQWGGGSLLFCSGRRDRTCQPPCRFRRGCWRTSCGLSSGSFTLANCEANCETDLGTASDLAIFPLIFRCIKLDSRRLEPRLLANRPCLWCVPRATTVGTCRWQESGPHPPVGAGSLGPTDLSHLSEPASAQESSGEKTRCLCWSSNTEKVHRPKKRHWTLGNPGQ